MNMGRILLVALYLSGWNVSTSLLHQYHYVSDLKTWSEAQTYCRQTYTDLATIENTEEMNQLINTVSSAGYNSEVWIGLYNQIKWTWSDGYTGSGAEYRNWKTNQPDFVSASQYCTNIGDTAGLWWDDNCDVMYPFICYRGSQLNPEYVLMNERRNWSSAQSYCKKNFTDLVTVRNQTENHNIQNLVPSGDWAWIGLFRDLDLYWSDQSNFSFSYWGNVRNPINWMNIICSVADLQNSGKWKFLPCGTRKPSVCYSSPVQRQVVKLKVTLEISSVDLNDPAMKGSFLIKIQDRLESEGVSGVTLKWREQADGKVFHKDIL